MRSVVFTFGRMSPPTRGHERLILKLLEVSRQRGSDHAVFLSQTQDKTQNPLSWSFKTRVCQAAFPGVNISTNPAIKTPFQALESLAEHYDQVLFVAGGDRLYEYIEKMTPYAQQWGIKDFQVISAGERNPHSRGLAGVSGTKLREYALKGNSKKFIENLPSRLTESLKEEIYQQTILGLKNTDK